MKEMPFKLFFTHRVEDIFNDIIYIILNNDDVYVATLFTLKNIDMLMRCDEASYFWASDYRAGFIPFDDLFYDKWFLVVRVLRKNY